MKTLLSVIIPVYNTEDYVEQCVRSVVSQPGSECVEVILIDDGSKDNSGHICDCLATENSKIHVYHQENKGPSGARNLGISMATGDYLMFLDSDDFLSQGTLKKVIEIVNSSKQDLYLFSVQSCQNGKITNMFFDTSIYPDLQQYDNGQSALKGILKKDYNYGWCAVWHIISRRILSENGLLFPEGYLCEDVYFSFRLWLNANKIQTIPVSLYNYRRDNQTSTTHVASFKFADDLLEMCLRNIELVRNVHDSELRDLLKLNIQTLFEVVLVYYYKYPDHNKKELKQKMNKLCDIWILENKSLSHRKERVVKWLLRLLGPTMVSCLWQLKLRFNH